MADRESLADHHRQRRCAGAGTRHCRHRLGGAYAQSAARALLENTELPPLDIVTKSLEIAGDLCIYTNRNFTLETLE